MFWCIYIGHGNHREPLFKAIHNKMQPHTIELRLFTDDPGALRECNNFITSGFIAPNGVGAQSFSCSSFATSTPTASHFSLFFPFLEEKCIEREVQQPNNKEWISCDGNIGKCKELLPHFCATTECVRFRVAFHCSGGRREICAMEAKGVSFNNPSTR